MELIAQFWPYVVASEAALIFSILIEPLNQRKPPGWYHLAAWLVWNFFTIPAVIIIDTHPAISFIISLFPDLLYTNVKKRADKAVESAAGAVFSKLPGSKETNHD